MEQSKTVIFYKFYLQDVAEPIVIEALNKDEAVAFLQRHKKYIAAPIVGLHVSKPLFAITKKEERGISYIWCGFENSPNGWMEQSQFAVLSAAIEK
jgi:hypothetical protein